MQPFVVLDRWNNTALAHMLNKLVMENTSTSVNMLANYSQGWYLSLNNLLIAKNKRSEITRIDGFGQAYGPLKQAKPKSLDEFLTKSGINSVAWGLPVMSALYPEESFDEDDIALQLLELGLQIEPKQAFRWLFRLRLIEPVNPKSRQITYRVTESVVAALKARSAVETKA